MRKFNLQKAYKLIIRITLLLGIFAIVVGSFMLYNVFYGPSSIKNIDSVCPPDSFQHCKIYFLLGKQDIESNAWKLLGLGIFAPILLLIARAIYAYIFTVEHKR